MSLKKASLCLSALLVVGGCKPDPEFSAVTVTCEPAPVPATRPAQCTASATDQEGKSFEVPGFTWTSSDASVAKVDSTGKVTTFTPGTATISASATADGVTHQGQATLTVANEAQPTRHSTPITTNETWREAENPHVVTGSIEVGGAGSPTLTLEPGVRIRFDQDAELRVTQGALKAMGTQEAPILMVANQSAPTKGYWRGVAFTTAGSASELNSVTLSDCGRDTGEGACIAMKNQAAPVLRNVTVRNSDIAGVKAADDDSGFGTGSIVLSVSDSGSYAVVIGANQAGTLPTGGSFTGNLQNAVEIRGNVSRTQTWPNLGIPYDVNDIVRVQGATTPTLTLSAGTVLRFGPNYALYVGDTAPGGLVVDGTAASPVLLTANSASPQPGHWGGVHLWSKTSNTTRLSYTTIEYGGAEDQFHNEAGNLNVHGDMAGGGARPVINNVILRKSGNMGVLLKEDGAFGPGSTVLSVLDSFGPAIFMQPNYVGTIPTGGTISGNYSDVVVLTSGSVLTTQTWPNLGTNVYYDIRDNVNVGSASNPTLTLRPGTDVRFSLGSELRVGANGQPGALIAAGTAAAPIRFQPTVLPPSPGHWRGIHFWQASGSKLDHVIVTHAGLKGTSGFGTGNVNVHQEIGGFITNSTFSDSSGCGLSRADGSYTDSSLVTTDFTLPAYNNTFANNAGGAQCTNIN
ncbi:Ig-like domain-containing protein [Archangium violaceum]|uniref:Ig-like domain-containing protein n=1 Tax=Archangium violaceum TaxID=83451 RepID=UPI00194EC68E|nr:Ig-like domain-containing protein [Archangium violaceum]QRN93351.1 Ig-like domain-containing protein [Archangium violaceum]